MKQLYLSFYSGYFLITATLLITLFGSQRAAAQFCPANGTLNISSYPNTYYSPSQGSLAAGSSTIGLSASKYGTAPITRGDVVLIIQMQGAQIKSNNSSSYGDGSGTGSGYLSNGKLLAGKMEFAVAANSVGLSGGTLVLTSGLQNSYKEADFGTDGQYTYQVIRVPYYYNVQLTATIHPPHWDGTQGGVVVLYATNNILMNGKTIDASGYGFRGGGGVGLNGTGNNTYSSSDYVTLSTVNANGSKGEGIAGTPSYVNDSNVILTATGAEGYPNGSYAQGAPGNAGGGGTDGDPNANDQNTGGGGGSNGGWGGYGGNAWSSATTSGGRRGAPFQQYSASRLVMGGGGGSGTTNNNTGTPGNGFASSGAAGGGIIILIAQNAITGTGTILANGATGNSTIQNDGAGGGGGGGSIVIYSDNGITSNITVQAMGGNGGSNEVSGGPSHGPGGGGGGGVIFSNSTLAAGSSSSGGTAGTTSGTSSYYGATTGGTGVTKTNMNQSAFAQIPGSCTVLAVGFSHLSATPGNGVVNLTFTATQDVPTADYIIERSLDGSNFSPIGTLPYHGGNGMDNVYHYADNSAYAVGGRLFYRVIQTGNGGQALYSNVVSVQLDGSADQFSVYPNPAQHFVTVRFTMTAAAAVSLRLFDLHGSRLWEQQFQASAGQNSLQIDRIGTLPDGIYLLQWYDGLSPRMVKVFVQH